MKLIKLNLFVAVVVLFGACNGQKDKNEAQVEMNYAEKADSLAHHLIITDGHIDLPYALQHKGFNLSDDHLQKMVISTDSGNFDFERAKQGGLDAPFMSIYVAATFQETGGAKEEADTLISYIHGIINSLPDKFAPGRSPQEIEENFKKGLISLPMGLENGAPIGDDLSNVKYFFDKGIRYITLTHSKDNQICDSSYDTARTWNGLSPFGVEVVKEMNRVGIMVDVSHLSDSTFYDIMKITQVPVIASHSSCRHFTPGWERNMSDDMIKVLGERGGVLQINLGTSFLDGDIGKINKDNEVKMEALLTEKGLEATSIEGKKLIADFKKENPELFSTLQRVADHIDNVVEIAGIDHVGIGTDFDGVDNALPEGLKDVSQYPNLIEELLKRGYSEGDIEKICYKNVWRVWNEVQKVAGLL